ncbi:MAG: hypothetical protein Aurels2KO_16960 [Aureliella sp.]
MTSIHNRDNAAKREGPSRDDTIEIPQDVYEIFVAFPKFVYRKSRLASSSRVEL